MKTFERTCVVCGTEFTAQRDYAKFCCKACRMQYHAEKTKRERKEFTKNCKNCGKEFVTHIEKKLFCHIGCSNQFKRNAYAERKKQREKLNEQLKKTNSRDLKEIKYARDKELTEKSSTMYYKYTFGRGVPAMVKPLDHSTVSLIVLNHYWKTGAIKIFTKETK